MKPTPMCRLYNNVQTDRQWQRRCKEEVLQLLDSYAGSKAERIYE